MVGAWGTWSAFRSRGSMKSACRWNWFCAVLFSIEWRSWNISQVKPFMPRFACDRQRDILPFWYCQVALYVWKGRGMGYPLPSTNNYSNSTAIMPAAGVLMHKHRHGGPTRKRYVSWTRHRYILLDIQFHDGEDHVYTCLGIRIPRFRSRRRWVRASEIRVIWDLSVVRFMTTARWVGFVVSSLDRSAERG